MGRYMSGGNTGGTASAGIPRRQEVVLTSSNAALAIPAWAQGGKGIARVTGIAGGGGGGGSAGGTGATAHEHPVLIPAGQTTIAAVVAAGGAAGVSGSTAGGTGGNTTVSIGGVEVLRLGGGSGGAAADTLGGGGPGGEPSVYGRVVTLANRNTSGGSVLVQQVENGAVNAANGAGMVRTLARGIGAYNCTTQPATAGNSASQGTPSPFGGDISGYGYGGKQSTAGGPGMLIIEFVEGL